MTPDRPEPTPDGDVIDVLPEPRVEGEEFGPEFTTDTPLDEITTESRL